MPLLNTASTAMDVAAVAQGEMVLPIHHDYAIDGWKEHISCTPAATKDMCLQDPLGQLLLMGV